MSNNSLESQQNISNKENEKQKYNSSQNHKYQPNDSAIPEMPSSIQDKSNSNLESFKEECTILNNNAHKSKLIGNYSLGKTLGEGTFGKVKLGIHILTDEKVAIKILEKHRIVDVADVERVSREIHILKLLRHTNIIQLYEIIETPKQLFLIMEYAENGELFEHIVKQKRVKEKEAVKIFQQIINGVEYIHKLHVVHRDLKPENLLLTNNKTIKIVDFGLSNTYKQNEQLKTACGSPCYAAPEMIAGKLYNGLEVDIWSCGVILYALVCGYLPFEDPNTSNLYSKILAGDYQIPNFISQDCQDLITKILNTNPKERYTIQQIRQHQWYNIAQSHTPVSGIIIGYNRIPIDMEILEKCKELGLNTELILKCLEANKHNHSTTTYYLLLKKHVGQGYKSVADINSDSFDPSLLIPVKRIVRNSNSYHGATQGQKGKIRSITNHIQKNEDNRKLSVPKIQKIIYNGEKKVQQGNIDLNNINNIIQNQKDLIKQGSDQKKIISTHKNAENQSQLPKLSQNIQMYKRVRGQSVQPSFNNNTLGYREFEYSNHKTKKVSQHDINYSTGNNYYQNMLQRPSYKINQQHNSPLPDYDDQNIQINSKDIYLQQKSMQQHFYDSQIKNGNKQQNQKQTYIYMGTTPVSPEKYSSTQKYFNIHNIEEFGVVEWIKFDNPNIAQLAVQIMVSYEKYLSQKIKMIENKDKGSDQKQDDLIENNEKKSQFENITLCQYDRSQFFRYLIPKISLHPKLLWGHGSVYIEQVYKQSDESFFQVIGALLIFLDPKKHYQVIGVAINILGVMFQQLEDSEGRLKDNLKPLIDSLQLLQSNTNQLVKKYSASLVGYLKNIYGLDFVKDILYTFNRSQKFIFQEVTKEKIFDNLQEKSSWREYQEQYNTLKSIKKLDGLQQFLPSLDHFAKHHSKHVRQLVIDFLVQLYKEIGQELMPYLKNLKEQQRLDLNHLFRYGEQVMESVTHNLKREVKQIKRNLEKFEFLKKTKEYQQNKKKNAEQEEENQQNQVEQQQQKQDANNDNSDSDEI